MTTDKAWQDIQKKSKDYEHWLGSVLSQRGQANLIAIFFFSR